MGKTWVQIPTVPLTNCVTVGKLLNLPELGFLVYKIGVLIHFLGW